MINFYWCWEKSDQLFVEKTKLAMNLYMENLNQLSWNKSHTNYVQQAISKKQKQKQLLQI